MANRKNRSKAPRGQTATDTANMVSVYVWRSDPRDGPPGVI